LLTTSRSDGRAGSTGFKFRSRSELGDDPRCRSLDPDLAPRRLSTSHEANLTPQIFPCRQITSQLRVWSPSAKANSNRSGTSEELVVEILAPPWEISITRHSASVRSCTLIDACMLRVRRTSRLMRFLGLGIGQTYLKRGSIPRKSPAAATPAAPFCDRRLALRCRRV
jgi:hypothetical protein